MRNKILLTTMFLVALTTATFAQEVKFGVRGGLNLSTAKFTQEEGGLKIDYEPATSPSYFAGALVEYTLPNDKFAIQAETIFNMNPVKVKGETIDDFFEGFGFDTGESTPDQTVKIGQISVPVSLKYSVIEPLNIVAGASTSYLLSAKSDFEDVNNEDVKDDFDDIDYGVHLGAELELEGGLFFDARYNFALNNLSSIEEEDGLKNIFSLRSINVGVGYKF